MLSRQERAPASPESWIAASVAIASLHKLCRSWQEKTSCVSNRPTPSQVRNSRNQLTVLFSYFFCLPSCLFCFRSALVMRSYEPCDCAAKFSINCILHVQNIVFVAKIFGDLCHIRCFAATIVLLHITVHVHEIVHRTYMFNVHA